MKKFRCAVIGCGRIGCGFDDNQSGNKVFTHAGAYHKNPNVSLVALCDIDKKKLTKYATKYNVKKKYTKSKNMFLNEKLDCVSICTLTKTHLELVQEAAKVGIKGIFLEKPISDNINNSKKIIKICKNNKIKLIIDHQRRFNPFYHSIKKLMKNKLGQIQLVTVSYGAGIANTATHVFDLLRFFFGDAIYVKGSLSNNKSSNHLDPNIDVEIKYKNNIIARLNALDVNSYGILEMNIFGTKGRFVINLVLDKIDYYKISRKNRLTYNRLEKSYLKIKQSNKSSIMLGVENLLDCVLGKNYPMCTGDDGKKALELIIASIMSAKKQRKILVSSVNQKMKLNSK